MAWSASLSLKIRAWFLPPDRASTRFWLSSWLMTWRTSSPLSCSSASSSCWATPCRENPLSLLPQLQVTSSNSSRQARHRVIRSRTTQSKLPRGKRLHIEPDKPPFTEWATRCLNLRLHRGVQASFAWLTLLKTEAVLIMCTLCRRSSIVHLWMRAQQGQSILHHAFYLDLLHCSAWATAKCTTPLPPCWIS